MKEYLTVKELSSAINYAQQTLYNLISKKVFVLGVHYLKPTPKKILFKWSEIKKWLGDVDDYGDENPFRSLTTGHFQTGS